MTDHLRIILLLFVVAAAIVGTSGYSAIQADRSTDVAVVDDDQAYIVIDETEDEIANGSTGTALEVTNQFAEPVEVTATPTHSPDGITVEGFDSTSIEVEETAGLQVRCGDSRMSDGTITVDLTAEGDETSFETSDEAVTVRCTNASA